MAIEHIKKLSPLLAALLLTFNIASAGPNEDLIAAVDKGELAKAERALKRKANPEARGKQDATALMLAAELGHVDIAKLLLGAGANVATTRTGGIAAIHHAAGGGKVETLKLLLTSGASVSARTDSGITPLIAAGSSGKLDAVKVLLDAGADRSERDNNTLTAFMTAAQSGCVDCLPLLRIPNEDINTKTAKGHSVLDYAIASRSPAVLQYLFDQGAALEATESAKDQALFFFIRTHTDVLLNKPGASIETFRMLIAHGANLEAKNGKSQTPLIFAAQMGDLPAVEALIEAKANLNARDGTEATALMRAASRNVAENAKMMVAIGDGASMKQVFTPAEKSDKSPATTNRLAVARALLQAGSEVNAVDKDGDTPLHNATQLGDIELVELLLGAGADVNARSKSGRTPLMTAATWNYAECADALLAAGADPAIATQDGRTALSIAESNKSAAVLKLLKEAQEK